MIISSLRAVSCISLAMFSLSAFAEDLIKITVKTDEKTAAAIGYAVGGKALGGLGKSYSGSGPTNKTYVFGYRKHSIYGANVTCGELILNKDSTVVIVADGNKCQVLIN